MTYRNLLICSSLLAALTLYACSSSSDKSNNPTGPGGGSPTIVTLASGLMNPVGLAVDGSSVYWSESQDGATATTGKTWVSKVGLTGGSVTVLVTHLNQNNYVNTWNLAIDASFVYWVESNQDEMAIRKVSISGGSYTTVVSQYPKLLAADASSIYFSDIGTALTYGGTVRKVSKSGGPAGTIASGQGEPNHIAVYGSNVCWVNDWDGWINKTSTIGGMVSPVVQTTSNCAVAMDSSYIYFTYTPAGLMGAIKRVGVNGGSVTTLATSPTPIELVLDATNVYWTEATGKIYRVPKAGGTATSISVTSMPTFIALDAGNVYWVDGSSVKKVAKW